MLVPHAHMLICLTNGLTIVHSGCLYLGNLLQIPSGLNELLASLFIY